MPDPRPPTIPRTVWVLGFVSLLTDVSSEIVAAVLPFLLVGSLGASAATLGFVEGFAVLVASTTKLFAGIVTDRTGRRKPVVLLGYGLGALSKLVVPLAASVGWIVAAKAMDRVGKGIRGTARDALIADVTPPGLRGASFGLRKSLDTVGGFIGPLAAIALLLVLAGDVQAVLWLATVPAFLAVALLAVGIREPARPSGQGRDGPPAWSDIVRLEPAVWRVVAVASVLTAARFSEAFLLLKAFEAGLPLAWVPITLVVMHAVYGAAAFPVGRLSDRTGRTGPLIASVAFLVAAYLTLAAASSIPVFLAGVVLWGLHMGFSQGLLSTLVADAASPRLRGSAFGAFNLVTGLAVLAGNVGAGLLWDAFGSTVAFLAGAALALVAALFLIALPARGR